MGLSILENFIIENKKKKENKSELEREFLYIESPPIPIKEYDENKDDDNRGVAIIGLF